MTIRRAVQIAGSWTAKFNGRTFVKLELKTVDGKLTGGISVGSIEVDQKGALSEVGESPRELTPIFDVTQRASMVTFSRKDGNDTDRFELRLVESGRALDSWTLGPLDPKDLR